MSDTTAQADSHTALARTVQHIVSLSQGRLDAGVGVAQGDDWHVVADLVVDPTGTMNDAIERTQKHLNTTDRHAPASFLLKSWSTSILTLTAGAFVVDRRVPLVDASHVMLHFGEGGRVDSLSLLGNAIAVLPDDPAAGQDGTFVVEDEQELRSVLLRTVTQDHFSPVIDAFRLIAPFGERFMWATIADHWVALLLLIGKRTNLLGRCKDEAEAIVMNPPLAGRTGVMTIEREGVPEHHLKRGCCCFAYRLDQYDRCASCPLRPYDEQVDLLLTRH